MQTRRWLGVLGVGLGEALIAVNFSIVSTGLATIQKETQASLLELQWMLNIFGIFLCACLVTMGRLADTYGRVRLYLIGMLGSGIASLIAGAAPHPIWIIIAQGLQGIFGAILLAVSQALMVHLFPDDERGKAIGIWSSIAGITLGLGPIIAGSIITLIGWRWIFFINVPVALLGFLIVLRFVQESKSLEHRGELDYRGMFLLMLTTGSFVLGVMQGPHWGWTSLWSFLSLGCFIVCLPLLIYYEKKASFPIIHPEFFLKRSFLLPSLANFCTIFFTWTAFFLFPLYFQSARDDTAFRTGLFMLGVTAPVACFSAWVGKRQSKTGPKPFMIVGFCVLLLSIFLQFFLTPNSPIALVVAAPLAFGFGWLLTWGPSITAAVSSFPKDMAGVASGAFTTIQELGATIGLTITGTVFRINPHPFMEGYRDALWVLVVVIMIGFFSSLSMRKRSFKDEIL